MGVNSDILGLPKGAHQLLRDLIHERTGLFYDNGKSDLLTDKISPLIVERGLNSFLDYYYLLKYDSAAGEEWRRVIDALSVQETFFWREMDQVRALVGTLAPQWLAEHRGETLRIWSVACATGEEPLTIAMALNEAGWFDAAEIEIVAGDASAAALHKARRGLYRERSFRSLPPSLRDKYFTREGAEWRGQPQLHARVKWMTANLANASEVALSANVPFIFCRNVFIYFSEQAIRKTVRMFATQMRRPGYLFVSASESLLKLTNDFELREISGAFVYVTR